MKTRGLKIRFDPSFYARDDREDLEIKIACPFIFSLGQRDDTKIFQLLRYVSILKISKINFKMKKPDIQESDAFGAKPTRAPTKTKSQQIDDSIMGVRTFPSDCIFMLTFM